MANKYIEVLGNISPTARGAQHAADIVAALTPPIATTPGSNSSLVPTRSGGHSLGSIVKEVIPGVIGGALGALVFKKHRVLGLLGGHALGSTAYQLYRNDGDDREIALYRLGIEGAGIAGALAFKKHRALGWIGGVASAAAVSTFIPGSPVRYEWDKLVR